MSESVAGPLPTFITFTGLDAWTDLDRVEELSQRYPIEWGILFSPKRQGEEARYPSLFNVGRMTHRLGNLNLAAHLCGEHARTVLAQANLPTLKSWLDCAFGRFQINTSDPTASPRMVAEFADNFGGTGILQSRSTGSFPPDTSVEWLYDTSGGRGEAPKAWPPHPGRKVGYAGGITHENARDILAAINAAGPYWIDMESGVRTDDRLDLGKCEAVCRAVYGPSDPRPCPLSLTGRA